MSLINWTACKGFIWGEAQKRAKWKGASVRVSKEWEAYLEAKLRTVIVNGVADAPTTGQTSRPPIKVGADE